MLIDSRYNGGVRFDRVINDDPVRAGEVDLQMQLRDVSVAYTVFRKPKSAGFGPDKLMLSLSARNMLTIYSSIDGDTELVEYIYSAKKNISLSITAGF
jgi:hypothetical protein